MTPTTARRLSRAMIVSDLVLLSAAAAALALTPRGPGPVGSDWIFLSVTGVVTLVYAIVGSLIVSSQPRNTIGWIFAEVAFVSALWGALSLGSIYVLKHDPGSGVGLAMAWVGNFAWLAGVAQIGFVFLLFPDGRAPRRRWRALGWALGVSGAVAALAFALTPDPTLNNVIDAGIRLANPVSIGTQAVMATITGIAGTATLILSALTVFAIRGRFKRGTPEERQQIRWLAAVGTTAGLLLVLMALLGLPLGTISTLPIFPILLLLFVFTLAFGIPTACAVAILKYHLFDLDVVIKKAVVALTLTLLIGGTGLFLLAVSSQVLLWGDQFLTLVGGVGLGLMIVPFLRLCRRIATRITFGKRATPYEVLTAFGERVGETYSTEDVLPRMAHLLASATGATAARVLLRVGGELREEAAWPEGVPPHATGHMVPVRHQDEDLGALSVTMPPSDPMNPAKEKLIEDLAAQAGLVLRNVKLIEELRASRQRLVSSQDEERRKIERNLHDGAQQQLVALAVQLKLARQLVERDQVKAGEMLDSLQGTAGAALEDLRDLARGIYPPVLADQGLGAALEAQARKAAVPTTIEADGLDRFPQDVESAVYFCTLEALNNSRR